MSGRDPGVRGSNALLDIKDPGMGNSAKGLSE